jgi:hypothetical protein
MNVISNLILSHSVPGDKHDLALAAVELYTGRRAIWTQTAATPPRRATCTGDLHGRVEGRRASNWAAS